MYMKYSTKLPVFCILFLIIVFNSAGAIIVEESIDFREEFLFSNSGSGFILDLGSNLISGSLSSECIDRASSIDCTPTFTFDPPIGDPIDVFTLSVGPGTGIESIVITTSNGLGPLDFTAGITQAQNTFIFNSFDNDIVELNNIQSYFPLYGITDTFEFSIFGLSASESGEYSFDYTIEIITAVPLPSTLVFFLIRLIVIV